MRKNQIEIEEIATSSYTERVRKTERAWIGHNPEKQKVTKKRKSKERWSRRKRESDRHRYREREKDKKTERARVLREIK